MRQRLFPKAMLVLALAGLVSMGATGCVTKAEFNEYQQRMKADGEDIERWAKDTQRWMNEMVQWVRSMHPDGVPPAPPSPPPCENDCEWGTD